jgi:hypothetical protein
MNIKVIIAYFFCLTLFGCNHPNKEGSRKSLDSTNNSVSSDSNEDTDPKEVKRELIESYSKILSIDTTFYIDADKYKIVLMHYCTLDSAIVIPARYDFDTHTDFITSNFESTIKIIKNQDTIFNKVIEKTLFKKLLFPQLDSFAILLFPNFKLSNDTIEIHYSISIPITDVGVSATIKIDTSGSYYITN